MSESLGDQLWAVVSRWSAFEKDTIGRQLVRAADSVGANIAEGSGRGSPKDNQRFVRIARSSLHETQFWLKRAYVRKLIVEVEKEQLERLINRLAPMLNAYISPIGRGPGRQTRNTKHETPNA